jgi:hypothetical protein
VTSAVDWLPGSVRRVLGIVAATLPRRYWHRFEPRIPVTSSALPASLLTFLAGWAVGIPGFFAYASGLSAFYVKLLMDAADSGLNPTSDMAVGMNALAVFAFLFLTPAGLVTLYLTATGLVRFVSAWFDDPRGDAILSLVDWSIRRTLVRTRDSGERRERERLEGPETRDIVVTGERALVPAADLVIIASRRKPGWDRDTVVITESATYRIGEVVERTIEGRLRTLYPLIEHKDLEAFRRIVRYELGTKR